MRYAADGQRYQDVVPVEIEPLKVSSKQPGAIMVSIPFGKESMRVRMIQLYFPPGSLADEAKLTEMRFIYDWGPSEEAEFNPPILGRRENGPLSISISASASAVHGLAYSHVLTVFWKITGGTAPHHLTIGVTGPDGVTSVEGEETLEGTRRFELAYPDGGTVLVNAIVEDAAGSAVSGMASASLAR